MIRKLSFIILGAIVLCGLTTAGFYVVGKLFGPFYASEADQGRNLIIFLGSNLIALGLGGFIGSRMYKKKLTNS